MGPKYQYSKKHPVLLLYPLKSSDTDDFIKNFKSRVSLEGRLSHNDDVA